MQADSLPQWCQIGPPRRMAVRHWSMVGSVNCASMTIIESTSRIDPGESTQLPYASKVGLCP